MSNHQQPKILVNKWARIRSEPVTITNYNPLECSVPESLVPHLGQGIPMDKHLQELICIPEDDNGDFLHIYRAKFLPQKYDYTSQNLLRKYSNKIVKGLEKSRLGKLGVNPVNEYLRDFCNREGLGYEYLEYCTLTINYFIFLLPQMPLISKDKKHFVADLESVYGGDTSQLDGVLSNSIYHQRQRHSLGRVLSRFSFLAELYQHIHAVRIMIEQAGESQKFYSLAMEHDLAHQRRWIGQNARKSLRQCIYCYRFFEGVGRVPRTCSSSKCKRADKAWKSLLESKGHTPEDFYFFNRGNNRNG